MSLIQKWLVSNALLIFAAIVGWEYGIVQPLFTDKTHITDLIGVIFLITLAHNGYLSWKFKEVVDSIDLLKASWLIESKSSTEMAFYKLQNRIRVPYTKFTIFIIKFLPSIGMIGTIIGLVMGMYALSGGDIINNESARGEVFSHLFVGLGTSFFSILTSLLAACWLVIQVYMMSEEMDKIEKKVIGS